MDSIGGVQLLDFFKIFKDTYSLDHLPTNIYLFKVNNINTRKRCEICSKLTIKTELRELHRSGIIIVNFEHISTFL